MKFICKILTHLKSAMARFLYGAATAVLVGTFVVGSLFIAPTASAQTILRVDPDGSLTSDSPPPDGSDWGDPAYKYLQDALAVATANAGQSNPYQIWVRGETGAGLTYRPDDTTGFHPDGSGARGASFALRPWVSIYGQFPNTATDLGDRDPAYITILSGAIAGLETDYSYHVVTANVNGTVPENCRLEGLTIRDAYNETLDDEDSGGCIKIGAASPRINHCVITNGKAKDGAGAYVMGDILQDIIAAPVLTNCTISDNTAITGSAIRRGIGLFAGPNTDVTIITTVIEGNESDDSGFGGGVAVYDETEDESTAHATIINCLIRDNYIVGDIGAPTLNPSGIGGGVLVRGNTVGGATADIINCTIVNNTAARGGGVCVYDSDAEIIYLRNSILWFNTALAIGPADGAEIYLGNGNEVHAAYNDVRDRDDPEYVYGGDVVWITAGDPPVDTNIGENPTAHYPDFVNSSADPGGDNWRLVCGSPCINTGHPTSTIIPADSFDVDADADLSERTPDLDRRHRIVGSIGIARVDMGAYETRPLGGTCAGDIDGSCTVDVDDLVLIILAWGACDAPPALCPADAAPSPCGDGTVNVDDLLAVMLGWGDCPGGCVPEGTAAGANPESYEDCETLCEGKEGDDWITCMNGCFYHLCQVRGLTEFCDD